jgi:alkylated DNA repair dioxygenase AlkB
VTGEFFADDRRLVRLPMPDADVVLQRVFDPGGASAEVMARLVAETPWRSETVTLWGKTWVQPRLLSWHGDDGASYVYSGTRFEPAPWTPLLEDLRGRVEAAAGLTFNSVLLNYYRDHRDSMGMHSDDEPELGREPVIASLSFGETRTLTFRHRTDKSQRSWSLPLPDSSLLLMKGRTQACWQHGIAKVAGPCGARVNLTFRRIVTASRRTRGSA